MAVLAVKTAEQFTDQHAQRILGCRPSPGRYLRPSRIGTVVQKGKLRRIPLLAMAMGVGIDMEANA
jgi:hypothetical protein